MTALLAVAFLLAVVSPASAQHEISASVIGRAWSVDTSHQIAWHGTHQLSAAAARDDDRVDLRGQWDVRLTWLNAGVESRRHADPFAAYAGVAYDFPYVQVSAGVTDTASPRISVEGQWEWRTAVFAGVVVLTEDVADVRLDGRWRSLSVELWRQPGGTWTPRLAVGYSW